MVWVEADAIVTGVTERVSGKADRKAALSIGGAAGWALAYAVAGDVSPTAAIAVRVALELAAPA